MGKGIIESRKLGVVHMVHAVKSDKERGYFGSNQMNVAKESFGANVRIVLLGELHARVGNELIEEKIGKHGVPA